MKKDLNRLCLSITAILADTHNSQYRSKEPNMKLTATLAAFVVLSLIACGPPNGITPRDLTVQVTGAAGTADIKVAGTCKGSTEFNVADEPKDILKKDVVIPGEVVVTICGGEFNVTVTPSAGLVAKNSPLGLSMPDTNYPVTVIVEKVPETIKPTPVDLAPATTGVNNSFDKLYTDCKPVETAVAASNKSDVSAQLPACRSSLDSANSAFSALVNVLAQAGSDNAGLTAANAAKDALQIRLTWAQGVISAAESFLAQLPQIDLAPAIGPANSAVTDLDTKCVPVQTAVTANNSTDTSARLPDCKVSVSFAESALTTLNVVIAQALSTNSGLAAANTAKTALQTKLVWAQGVISAADALLAQITPVQTNLTPATTTATAATTDLDTKCVLLQTAVTANNRVNISAKLPDCKSSLSLSQSALTTLSVLIAQASATNPGLAAANTALTNLQAKIVWAQGIVSAAEAILAQVQPQTLSFRVVVLLAGTTNHSGTSVCMGTNILNNVCQNTDAAGLTTFTVASAGEQGLVITKTGFQTRSDVVDVGAILEADYYLLAVATHVAGTLVDQAPLGLAIIATIDTSGTFKVWGASETKVAILNTETTLIVKTGPTYASVTGLVVRGLATGTAVLTRCWTKGTVSTADDLCQDITVTVHP